MVDEIKKSDVKSLTLGKRNTLKSDAFKDKGITIGQIADKELKQFFGAMLREKGVDPKEINKHFIDETDFEFIFQKLEKAAGSDKSLSKEELLESHYAESKRDARKLFNSLKKLAKDAGEVVEKNEDGTAKSIKLNEYKKPKGEFDKQEGKVYSKEGKLLYQDKDIQFDGHPVTLRKYFKDGDEKQVDYEDMLVEGQVVARTKTDEKGNKVKVDIKTGEQETTTPEGKTTVEKGAVKTVTNPDGTTVKTVDKGNGVTVTVTTTTNKNGEKTAVYEENGQKHTVRYDKDGNTYVAVKTGESFLGTAARLGFSEKVNPEKFAEFRKLNEHLIHKFNTKAGSVEGFLAGATVRYPGTLEYNANTAEILDVNAAEEEAKYAARRGKAAKPAAGVKPASVPEKAEGKEPIPEPSNKIPDKLDFTVGAGIDADNPKVKTLKADVQDIAAKQAVGEAPEFELTQEKLIKFAKGEDGKRVVDEEIEYKDGVRAKHISYSDGKQVFVGEYKNGIIAKETALDESGKPESIKQYKNGELSKAAYFRGDTKLRELVFNGKAFTETTFAEDNKVVKTEKFDADGNIYERKTFAGDTVITETKDDAGNWTTKTVINKPEVVSEETKGSDGRMKLKNMPQNQQLAESLYKQIDGASLNSKTNEILSSINKNNVVEVMLAYKEYSDKMANKDNEPGDEPKVGETLITALNNEYEMWGGTKLKKAEVIKALWERAQESNGAVPPETTAKLYSYIVSGELEYDDNLDKLIDEITGYLIS